MFATRPCHSSERRGGTVAGAPPLPLSPATPATSKFRSARTKLADHAVHAAAGVRGSIRAVPAVLLYVRGAQAVGHLRLGKHARLPACQLRPVDREALLAAHLVHRGKLPEPRQPRHPGGALYSGPCLLRCRIAQSSQPPWGVLIN